MSAKSGKETKLKSPIDNMNEIGKNWMKYFVQYCLLLWNSVDNQWPVL